MNPLRFLIILCIITFSMFLVLFIYVKYVTATGMPSLEQLENPKQNLATQIFSADGELIDHFFIERRISLPYESIPPSFVNALIATEDRKFWRHWGVHVERIFKAATKSLLAGSIREGASTITMQLARNLYLDQSVTLERKIREAFTAIQIERTYTKEEILTLYSNTVHFGLGVYGIEFASQLYFNKNANELEVGECAMLVGILPLPARYNPFTNYDRALQRRNLVLGLMRDQDFLNESQYREEISKPLNIYSASAQMPQRRRLGITEQSAPHFVEMIRQNLDGEFRNQNIDIYRDGLIIHTTLNYKVQDYVNQAVEEHLKGLQAEFDRRWNWSHHPETLKGVLESAVANHPEYKVGDAGVRKSVRETLLKDKSFIDSVKKAVTTIQVSVVILNPVTGAIISMVGASPRFMQEVPTARYSLNHATQIRRQPGSAFKPFVYAAALMNGYLPSDTVGCGPFTYKLETDDVWTPRGTGRCEEGETRSFYSAMQSSINTSSARIITRATSPSAVVRLSKKMGINSPLKAVPALSLGGGGEVVPLEIASAYSTFLYNGLHVAPYFLEQIDDHNGNTVRDKSTYHPVTDVMDKEIAAQMTFMLEGVVNGGTGSIVRRLLPDIDAAGKTGTTNDAADAWFVGFTPQLVGSVWVGFDDPRITFTPLGGEGYGGRAAAPIFGLMMQKIYADKSLGYNIKEFPYKTATDASWEYGLPYPITSKQKEHLSKRKDRIHEDVLRETFIDEPNTNNNTNGNNNNNGTLPNLQRNN